MFPFTAEIENPEWQARWRDKLSKEKALERAMIPEIAEATCEVRYTLEAPSGG